MSLDYRQDWEDLKERTIKALSDIFPVQTKNRQLHIRNIEIKDDLPFDDYRSQLEAKLNKKSWTVPVKAEVVLKNEDGKIIDKRKMVVAHIPKLTPRHSFIVDGNEYQTDHLWVRRPGVYSRITRDGKLESEFNLAKGKNFRIQFDPEDKKFTMLFEKTKIPLGPVLKDMVSEQFIHSAFGKKLAEEVMSGDKRTAYNKLSQVLGTSPEDATTKFLRELENTSIDPEVTELTLGKKFERVTPETILLASKKLLDISRGIAEPDNRDAVIYKELHNIGDKLYDRLTKNKPRIHRKLLNRLEGAKEASSTITSSIFDNFIKNQFVGSGKEGSSLSELPNQLNPVDWLLHATKTTVLAPGEGGIESEEAVIDSLKQVDPTHLGFLDPIATPESSRAGITLFLPMATFLKDRKPQVGVYDLKEKAVKFIDPITFYKSKVVLPDELKASGSRLVPKRKKVLVSAEGNKFEAVPVNKARYALATPLSVLSLPTALVPYLNSNSGARISMVARHLSQALPLEDPEAPLVKNQTLDKVIEDRILDGFTVRSKITGTVEKVDKDKIVIKGREGTFDHPKYYYFPLNANGAFAHHEVRVKEGDKVKEGDILADFITTKDGSLALGKNLRVMFGTIPGKTIEDGIAVSETAAKKLTSRQLNRYHIVKSEDLIMDPKKYWAYYPTKFKKEQLSKLDSDGVIKKGQKLLPGDPIYVALEKNVPASQSQLMKKLSKGRVNLYRDKAEVWDEDTEGEVIDVLKSGNKTLVLVHSKSPLKIGDKITGRHGNKGVVTDIIPDHEMPRDKEGRPVEVVISPLSVPGRTNVGQVYELLTAKVAEKLKKPITVPHFGENNYKFVADLLKKHNVPDTEEIYDPSGRKLGKAMVGPLYMLKLKHIVEDKYSERSGGPGEPYDINRQPVGESGEKGQSLGSLEQYALLAHNARAILKDVHTRASDADNADEVWRAIQLGAPLPPPKVPFVYKKFESYLKGLGLALKKEGNTLRLLPMTDKEVLESSGGEIKSPETLRAKDLKPVPGGLFDEKATKGLNGDSFAHITLPEPMPNPVFEEGLRALTGLTKDELRDVLAGKKGLPQITKKADITVNPEEGLTGPQGLKEYIDSLDINREIRQLQEAIPRMVGEPLDKANKRLRVLLALKKTGLKPSEAYFMKYVPVIPPVMRKVVVRPDGNLAIDDMNELYRQIIMGKDMLAEGKKALPKDTVGELRLNLYENLSDLVGLSQRKRVQGGTLKGILDILSGNTPKESFFQAHMIKKRQDLSGRMVLTSDPSLGIDEIVLPKSMGFAIYKPFVVRELTKAGIRPLDALKMIEERNSLAEKALENVAKERPVLMKRDPVLHKFGIMAYKPSFHDGKSIKISPLIMGPTGADIDGDTLAVYTPISSKAVKEAWTMMPSNNLFSPATGRLVYKPEHEGVVGLYHSSLPGKKKELAFKDLKEAELAFSQNRIELNDVIRIGGVRTTLGRARVYESLPESGRIRDILTNFNFHLDKKGVERILEKVAKEEPNRYSDAAKALLNVGSNALYDSGFSFSLKDFEPDTATRRKYLKPSLYKNLEGLARAGDKMKEEHIKKALAERNKLLIMSKAAGKPNISQYQSIKLSPVLFSQQGKPIPHPVTKSYAEGLDFPNFWHQSIGAREGVINKVVEVRTPGVLTKRMINTLATTVVTDKDCGTTEGEVLGIDHPDVIGRFLAKPVGGIGTSTILTPDIVAKLRKKGIKQVEVRSPLHCKLTSGICSKCVGELGGRLPQEGENVGIISAQSIGERGTQLTLKMTHIGGMYGKEAKVLSKFDDIVRLLRMPKEMPNAAVVSKADGRVERITKSPVGGWDVIISGEKHYVPVNRELKVKVGDRVERGDELTDGLPNPHDLLQAAGMEKTRKKLVDFLDNIYSQEGVKRRHIENLIRGLTNTVMVTDPGDSDFVRGDTTTFSKVKELNKELTNKIKAAPVLKGLDFAPISNTDDFIARLNHIRLKDTLIEAANRGLISKLHSLHPIPALIRGDIMEEGPVY